MKDRTMSIFQGLRPHAARLLAIAAVLVAYATAQLPAPAMLGDAAPATRFRFEQATIAEFPGETPRTIRRVHPSLKHIAGWISAVGAAVALADLDDDGLPDDVCLVDPRTDRVIISPAPGTSADYEPFAIEPTALPYDPETMAPMGCLPGDFNEDGHLDLLIYYWGRAPIAFLRRVGDGGVPRPFGPLAFAECEVAPGSGRWYTNAATSADLDGDGHLDIVLGNYFPDDSRILDSEATGIESMQDSMSRAANGGRNRLMLWAGATRGAGPSVRFRDASEALEETMARGWTLAAGAADLDGDLLPEIYFANDFGPDHLLHNRSTPGRLAFVPLRGVKTPTTPNSQVLGNDSHKGMGVDFGDLNGDGLPDIVVSNIAAERALEESHFAFLSTGRTDEMRRGLAPYRQAAEDLGLSRSGWGWDARLGDFDNDGTLELVQAAGFLRGDVDRWPELQELAMGNDALLHDPRAWPRFGPGDDLSGQLGMPFFARDARGRFHDISAELGMDEPQVSRGIATADVDGDGDLDFAAARQWAPSVFYRNETPAGGASLVLRLVLPADGSESDGLAVTPGPAPSSGATRPAIGAEAVVELPDGRSVAAQVDGGNGHSGKRSPDLHFGLGRLREEIRLPVRLRWRGPGGRVESARVHLHPGWHTVRLGRPPIGED